GRCPVPRRRSLRHQRYSVAVICASSALTVLAWNWAHKVHPGFTSTRKTPLAPWLNCDAPRLWRGTRGKSASKRKCGCHAREMCFCCREVYARGKAQMRSVVANGIALFLETSYDDQGNGAVCIIATCPARIGRESPFAQSRSPWRSSMLDRPTS